MVRLSVNINKVALIRNSRGANYPDLLAVAQDCERFGAQGITVHPRPDQRHVRYTDLAPLKAMVKSEFNIEGYPSSAFLDQVCEVRPHQCTLVPDPPDALTSDTGWDTKTHGVFLQEVVHRLHEHGIRVSLFLDPRPDLLEAVKTSGADRIELYTGTFAAKFPTNPEIAIAPFIESASAAADLGIGVNAGHDLNLKNLAYFVQHVRPLLEVSIGHALICDALYMGYEVAIGKYLEAIRKG